MKDELFSELIDSVREATEIRQGLKQPARVTTFVLPDVKAIRAVAGLTQIEFASVVGVSPSLVEAWEQKNRTPRGSSLKVLRLLEREPSMLNLIRSL